MVAAPAPGRTQRDDFPVADPGDSRPHFSPDFPCRTRIPHLIGRGNPQWHTISAVKVFYAGKPPTGCCTDNLHNFVCPPAHADPGHAEHAFTQATMTVTYTLDDALETLGQQLRPFQLGCAFAAGISWLGDAMEVLPDQRWPRQPACVIWGVVLGVVAWAAILLHQTETPPSLPPAPPLLPLLRRS